MMNLTSVNKTAETGADDNRHSDAVISAVGWYGMMAVLTAYTLVTFGIITASGVWYQLLNLTGALGLCVLSYNKKVWPNVWLNIFWAGIGLFTLIKIVSGF
jgi:hypothetical protein